MQDLWPTLRDSWLATRPASRDRVVTELRKAGLGDTSIKVRSKPGQMADRDPARAQIPAAFRAQRLGVIEESRLAAPPRAVGPVENYHICIVYAILRRKMESTERYFKAPTDHFFLLGPRGTGKTWLTQRCFPDALRVDLLEPETVRSLSARPERLRELIAARPEVRQVVIDEVQKLPELLEVAHLLIEEKQGAQFIFTGSSARTLRRAGVNLLGGRAAQKSLHPFMAAELGKQFRLEEALRLGMLPIVRSAKVPEEILRAYNGLYLREEVQMEGLVRNVGSFSRFLEAISFSQAAVLNLANVARECHVNHKTVEGYLEILEDLLLAFRVPVFTRRAKRKLAVHPKFFFFDAGVFRANRPAGPLDAPSEIDGAALEGLVAQHLRAWCDYSEGNHRLHYWQTRSKVEVDFVVYGEGGLHALEVKNAAQVRPEHLRGLKSFGEDFPESRRWLLYRGRERFLRDGILCVPCEEFLLELKPNHFPKGRPLRSRLE